MTHRPLNIVIAGSFPYPRGMATTRRIQRVIDGLQPLPDVSVSVLSLRQAKRDNPPKGSHRGTPYATVLPSETGRLLPFDLPRLWQRTARELRRARRSNAVNVLYKYASPSLEDVAPARHARRLGYKVVYDIIEDEDAAGGISHSPRHRIKAWFCRRLFARIGTLADGAVVISSQLERKLRARWGNALPLHLHRVSVDMSMFPEVPYTPHDPVRLFYAGSFGQKDGVEQLIDAFDRVAQAHGKVRLVLVGRGEASRVAAVQKRANSSPYRDRIECRGYLDDDDYYALLREIDIPCMTRLDTTYAQAGFPFKLGEFLAAGKPVIASRVSDVSDLLTDRVDAVLVPPGSQEAIAKAASYLIGSPTKAREIAANARKTAALHFDCIPQGERLHEFLLRTCGNAETL